MNQALINKYKILFKNKLFTFENGKAEYVPTAETSNIYLTDFLLSWTSPAEIEEYLIPEIEKILNGLSVKFETGTETISMDIGATTAIFYTENKNGLYPEIPTADLLSTLISWKEFLNHLLITATSPLQLHSKHQY